ncbi:MAG: PAS domain-containing sensor histidine kinase [Pseudomonadota bacterium]
MIIFQEFIKNNMDVVFFFYGFSFFFLGIVILAQYRATVKSQFKLFYLLPYLAWFGILHGTNELLDMFLLIKGDIFLLQVIAKILLPLSYFFLFIFGYMLIKLTNNKVAGIWIPIMFALLYILLPIVHGSDLGTWSTSARYFIGFPGAIMTSIGLLLYYSKKTVALKSLPIRKYFIILSISIGIYGVLGGLIVSQSDFFPTSVVNTNTFLSLVGYPVQFFRMICAMLAAMSIWRLMDIFKSEELDYLRKTKAELFESQQFSQAILDSVNEEISVIDPTNFKIVAVNNTFLNTLGLRKEEVIGKPCYEVTHHRLTPCMPPLDLCPLKETLEKGTHAKAQHIHFDKVGNRMFVEVTTSPVIDESGKITHVVHVAHDITIRKNVEIELMKAKEAAEMNNAAKTQFIANISHELRTPLNSIIGFAEILKDGGYGTLNENQLSFANDIWDSGKHLFALINEILDLTKIEAGKMDVDLRDYDIAVIIKNSASSIRKMISDNALSLSLDIQEDIGTIKCDNRMITQILINLLSNAVKFTPPGGSIGIETEIDQDRLSVTVWDNGIGIEENDKERVFKEFEQIDNSSKRKNEGVGLGLAVTKRLVELHGGKIWVESEGKDKGCRFTFILPIKA